MTAETLANNFWPWVGMPALVALFGVLALVDVWREWRRRRAVLRHIALIRRLGEALSQHEVIELLRREAKR